MKRTLLALLMALLCLCALSALAETRVDALLPTSHGNAVLHATPNSALDKPMEEDGLWLFLPAFADRQQITLLVDGQKTPVDWAGAQTVADGVEKLSIAGGTLFLMQSQNLRALFLESDDPVHQGREWLENCDRHQNTTSAAMALVDTDGTVDYAGSIKKLRGRGNSTWSVANKKPYQLKLEDKADLLKTGDPAECNRTWVLLADAMDVTLLHNRIALDLGLELGLGETSHSEHIDLYYDGEYRGAYLLCEKVELGEGRIEEMDSDKLLEPLQKNQSPDDLPVATAQNAYGLEYHYIQGAAGPEDPSSVAYLVEMESVANTLSERAWFTLGDGSVLGIKNPENPNQEMVQYISEKLESARRTLLGGGVNPDNGHTIQQDFDVDAFARLALLCEWAYNVDAFAYSSTWFVLPAGGEQFRPGPPWDFDLSMAEGESFGNRNGQGLKDIAGWLPALYRCDAFQSALCQIWRQEMYPLMENVFWGEEQGRYLLSLAEYNRQLGASRSMNDRLHPLSYDDRFSIPDQLQDTLDQLKLFLAQRTQWLNRQMELAAEKQVGYVGLDAWAIWLNPEETTFLRLKHLGQVELLDQQVELAQDTTEDAGPVYAVTIQLAGQKGWSMAEKVDVPPYMHGQVEDGVLTLTFYVQDAAYQPLWYEDTDYGMVFDWQFYAYAHPEIAELCGNDPIAMLERFLEVDIYKGRMGNDHFSPILTAQALPDVAEELGESWELYYTDFMDYGWEDWPVRLGIQVPLTIVPPPEED